MKSACRKRIVVWLTVIVLVSVFCLPARPAFALTIEQEKDLGRQFYEQLRRSSRFIDDPSVTGYVSGIGRKILEAAGPQSFQFQFFVLNNDVLNAFAVPGGYVFVHSGLLTSLKTEAQLAAIIGHEIAHVTCRHISDRIDKSRGLTAATVGGILAGIFLGGAAGQALMMGSMAGNVQAQLAYSRDDEREADSVGLEYLVQAGYNPRAAAQSFDILLRNQWFADNTTPTYVSTHPGLAERVTSVERAVDANPAYSEVKNEGDQKAFDAMQTKVLALSADPQRAMVRFTAAVRENPDDALGHYGMGLVYGRQQNYDAAVREFRAALAIQPANPGILNDLGDTLFQKKDFAGAQNALSKVIVLRPDWPESLYLLGRTYEEQGAVDRALQLYERATLLNPQLEDGLYRLGLLYGQQGNLALAHLNTGLYFKLKGDRQQAIFHLRKASENAGPASPEAQRRIRDALGELEKDDQKDREKKAEQSPWR